MDRDAQNVDAIKTKGVTLLLRDIDSSNLKLNPLRFAILSFCFVSLTFVIITIITILSHNCTLFPFAMCLMFCQATVATEEHSNSDNEEGIPQHQMPNCYPNTVQLISFFSITFYFIGDLLYVIYLSL